MIFDKILKFFGIRRFNLDKPLTLLGQEYAEVERKVYTSAYGLFDTVDWGIYYDKVGEEDPTVTINMSSTIKIVSTVIHDEHGQVVRAGKIYFD